VTEYLKEFKYEGKSAPISMVLRVSGLSSPAWYDKRKRKGRLSSIKPGPKVLYTDQEVVVKVKEVLSNPYFHGEGYKKLKVRLSAVGIQVGKERLLRLLKEHNLLAHQRYNPNGSSRPHTGTIITAQVNQMYACDIKEWRCKEGQFYMFTVIDHYNDEIISHLSSLKATAALANEVLRMAIIKRFQSVKKDICKSIGLQFRTDHGSQFIAQEFEKEVYFLGITLSRAFVRSPECNGVIERYHRTIKEQIGHLIKEFDYQRAFAEIDLFVPKYNQHWLLHRLGLQSPIEYRINNENKDECI